MQLRSQFSLLVTCRGCKVTANRVSNAQRQLFIRTLQRKRWSDIFFAKCAHGANWTTFQSFEIASSFSLYTTFALSPCDAVLFWNFLTLLCNSRFWKCFNWNRFEIVLRMECKMRFQAVGIQNKICMKRDLNGILVASKSKILRNYLSLTCKRHNAFHSPDPHKSSRGVWSRLADDLVDTAAASRWYCHCPFREHCWFLWRAALSLWWVHWALMTTKRLKETVIEVWFDAGWLSFHSHCPTSSADCPDRCSSIGSVRRCLSRPLTASVMYYGCLDYD